MKHTITRISKAYVIWKWQNLSNDPLVTVPNPKGRGFVQEYLPMNYINLLSSFSVNANLAVAAPV